jgi:hypothetical protein
VFAWRRWWSRDGLPALRLMALERWDPLGVYEQPERVDEYDASGAAPARRSSRGTWAASGRRP